MQDLSECTDPWGNLTIVLPHLETGVLHALCRLIYCGDSGGLTCDGMNDILGIIRPEYGGTSAQTAAAVESEAPLEAHDQAETTAIHFVEVVSSPTQVGLYFCAHLELNRKNMG